MTQLQKIKNQVFKTHTLNPDFRSKDVESSKRDWFLRLVHLGVPPAKWQRIAVPFFVEALLRVKTMPAMDAALMADLNFAHTEQPAAASKLTSRVSLWWMNNRIRRAGNYALLFARATRELKAGQLTPARKAVYRCLLTKLSCVGELEWLKLMAKLHGGRRVRAWFKPAGQRT